MFILSISPTHSSFLSSHLFFFAILLVSFLSYFVSFFFLFSPIESHLFFHHPLSFSFLSFLFLLFFDFFFFYFLFFFSELKFVKKTNQHIQLCAQRLTDEDALTAACFYNLEDDVIETERRSIRMHLLRWNGGVKNVISVKEVLQSESDLRLVEDSILLDTVIESQQLLQHTVSLMLCSLICECVCV